MKIAAANRRAIHQSVAGAMACLLLPTIGSMLYRVLVAQPLVMAAATPNYSVDIAPILNKNCGSCHSSAQHKSGLVLDSYDTLMKGGRHGRVILPHDPKGSRLMQMIEGETDPQMPLESDPLPAAEIIMLKSWIDAGALGPASNESASVLKTPSASEIRPEVNVVSPVTSVKFSPDGDVLAIGGYKQVRLIDAASGKLLATLSGHADSVRSIAFSPDGKLLAAAGGAPQSVGEIKIWGVLSHRLLKTMRGHKDCIYSIAWSPDGKLIASGSYDKTVKLWDVDAGRELRTLQDHIDAVFAVEFSPDGRRLASASQDRTVKIWNVATGRRLYTLSDAVDGLTSIAFSASGDQVAAGGYDKTIYIWHLAEEDGHLTQALIADEESLLAVAWSPDGKTIVTASADGSIRFRDAATLNPLGIIDKQPDWVQALDISRDGKWLAAGRYDGSLSLYDAKSLKAVRAPMTVFDPRQQPAGNQAMEETGK
jgi:dipeptidyl aminopeptidase/acylaminoacyl peptidase